MKPLNGKERSKSIWRFLGLLVLAMAPLLFAAYSFGNVKVNENELLTMKSSISKSCKVDPWSKELNILTSKSGELKSHLRSYTNRVNENKARMFSDSVISVVSSLYNGANRIKNKSKEGELAYHFAELYSQTCLDLKRHIKATNERSEAVTKKEGDYKDKVCRFLNDWKPNYEEMPSDLCN